MPTNAPATEHPFAEYVRILGKGKKGSRSLSQEEARNAMAMILDGKVEDVQLGAFLMLLRVKEESAEEIAGFVEAVRSHSDMPTHKIHADLDWSSYAGKRRHQPWFVLSALLLASNGYKVFMHGSDGHTAGRLYTEQVISELGINPCNNWEEVENALNISNFAYMSLRNINARLDEIIQLRPLLGLRSPVHTLVRLMNPLGSKHAVQGIFHPPYSSLQQEAAALLGEYRTAVFKGDSGEVERKPDADCLVKSTHNSEFSEEKWPRHFKERQAYEETLSVDVLKSTWRGETSHTYGEQAVILTTAVNLKLLEKADTQEQALELARQLWNERKLDLLN